MLFTLVNLGVIFLKEAAPFEGNPCGGSLLIGDGFLKEEEDGVWICFHHITGT